jgi:hypothetical protein
MRRFLPLVLAGAVAVALVVGAVVLAAGDGPYASTVAGHAGSQRTVDDELDALANNSVLVRGTQRLAAQNPNAEQLSRSRGSISVGYGTGWVSLAVAQEIVRLRVHRQGLEPTKADRAEAKVLAEQAVGGPAAYAAFPAWFRAAVVDRWTAVAMLERKLVAAPTPALLAAAAAQCPSGRYVAHILVGDRATADSLKAQLDAGGDFVQLAAANSIDTDSSASGGYYGCLDGLSGAVEPFLTTATTQPIGVVSDPVKTELGFHLILVTDAPSSSDLASLAVTTILQTPAPGTNVVVDPRYGTWDRKNGQVLPPVVPGAVS